LASQLIYVISFSNSVEFVMACAVINISLI
jgi:hypothetical protein